MTISHANKAKFLTPFILTGYCAWIYWLSAQSSLKPPLDFGILYQDKLYHAGAYFIMSVLAWHSFKSITQHTGILGGLCIAFCSAYGVTDEWHQSFVVGRSPDAMDWLADTVGASLAIFFCTQPTPCAQLTKITQK